MATTFPEAPSGDVKSEEGKPRKTKFKSEAIPYTFNGKTYACHACKTGHRVSQCDHGWKRPISATRQPGRPAAGMKRGCQCPKKCSHSGKCKCDRDCSCLEKMFLIVHVGEVEPIKRELNSSPQPQWEENGQQVTLKPVWADGEGKEIDEMEVERRRLLKEGRDAETPVSSCCSTKPKQELGKGKINGPSRGCRHRFAPKQDLVPSTQGCTCGAGCECNLCPEHPNNATSRNTVQQLANQIASQNSGYGNTVTQPTSFTPQTGLRSCTGGQATSGWLYNSANTCVQDLPDFNSVASRPGFFYTIPLVRNSQQTTLPNTTPLSSHHHPDLTRQGCVFPDSLASPAPGAEIANSRQQYDGNFSDIGLAPNDYASSWTDFAADDSMGFQIGGEVTVNRSADYFAPHQPQYPYGTQSTHFQSHGFGQPTPLFTGMDAHFSSPSSQLPTNFDLTWQNSVLPPASCMPSLGAQVVPTPLMPLNDCHDVVNTDTHMNHESLMDVDPFNNISPNQSTAYASSVIHSPAMVARGQNEQT